MCGIAGIFDSSGTAARGDELATMIASLQHRGPDDGGVWTDRETGISLGHRRLAIIDLSAAGHQPMQSTSGRYMMVYNGEVYNHTELRKELQTTTPPVRPIGEAADINRGRIASTISWRGHSDTETLLAGFETWGIEATLKRAVGMFALAVWDRRTRTLSLARDRLGEKPLYYGWVNGRFVFASELKAIRPSSTRPFSVDRGVLFRQR